MMTPKLIRTRIPMVLLTEETEEGIRPVLIRCATRASATQKSRHRVIMVMPIALPKVPDGAYMELADMRLEQN